jgi:hypothetical protein
VSDVSHSENPRPELGAGLSFPIRLDANGRFAMSSGPRKVSESVRLVLETAVSGRVMRSAFGSQVPALLFESLTPDTVARLRSAIGEALGRWEPRIDVQSVSVARDPDVETRVVASVEYRLRENNALYNQVYDFFVSEGAEDL